MMGPRDGKEILLRSRFFSNMAAVPARCDSALANIVAGNPVPAQCSTGAAGSHAEQKPCVPPLDTPAPAPPNPAICSALPVPFTVCGNCYDAYRIGQAYIPAAWAALTNISPPLGWTNPTQAPVGFTEFLTRLCRMLLLGPIDSSHVQRLMLTQRPARRLQPRR